MHSIVDGSKVSSIVGTNEGFTLGDRDGLIGWLVGTLLGVKVGLTDGVLLGIVVGL